MTIFRGPGGTGSATSDSDTTEFQEFLVQSQAARDAALAAQVAALSSQNAAATSATNAAASASSALASLNEFKGRYYGPLASDPTQDPLGNAPTAGDLYFNTGTNRLRVFNATTSTWNEGNAGSVAVQNFSGTGAQTAFSLAAAPESENNTQVYISGVYQQKTEYSISGTTLTFTSAPPAGTNNIEVVTMNTLPLGVTSDDLVQTAPAPGGLWTTVRGFITALASSAGSSIVGFTQSGTGAVARTAQDELRRSVYVEQFGAVGNNSTNCTTAIWKAIEALRANPVSILDTIGGSTITAYSSGIVNFGPGIFVIDADAFAIYQDLGLTLKGRGSRRTNNSVRAATTLVVKGSSTGFILKSYRNGGRALTIEDMDVCYEDATFTGDVLDIVDCPGVTLNRVFLGTFGLSAGARRQTARSCIRATYDEFLTANNCVFDGAVDGVWFDDVRIELGNTFGGSVTTLNQCVFYDFTNAMIRHDGNRTREGLVLNGLAYNPIAVDCARSVDLNNVEGVQINGGVFGGSVANKASVEWLRLANCTGHVRSALFNDLSKAGTIDGMIDVSGNRIFSTDGFTARGGVISGKSNEFSKATSGWTFSPTYALAFDVGPDLFKNQVTRSYDVPADSVSLAGRVNYDAGSDASTSKFRNTSGRVQVRNIDERQISVSSGSYSVSINDTGRTIFATGGSAQTFTLPAPVHGTKLTISKINAQNLTVSCAGGSNFYGQGSSYPTSASLTGAAMGTIELEAYATVGWVVKALVGSWTFA